MSRPKTLKKVKAGDAISAQQWNAIIDALDRIEISDNQCSGIDIQKTPTGTILRVVTPGNAYLARANGNISARSGTTPGTGTVTIQEYDGSAFSSSGVDIDVLNPSSSTMTSGNGIDSGMYCWIEQDSYGWWWVSPLECS